MFYRLEGHYQVKRALAAVPAYVVHNELHTLACIVLAGGTYRRFCNVYPDAEWCSRRSQ